MTNSIRVVFLDVGQGDCTIILLPNNHAILIDCPGHASATVAQYLKKENVSLIDLLIVTHSDADHFYGISSIINKSATASPFAVDIREVWFLPDRYARCKEQPKDYKAHVKALAGLTNRRQQPALARLPHEGIKKFVVPVGSDKLVLEVLHPAAGQYWRMSFMDLKKGGRNNNSVVLKATMAKKVLILGADVMSQGWNALLGRNILPTDIDILRISHHGGYDYEGVTRAIAHMKPRCAVISVGTGNTYTHPTSEVVTAVKKANSKAWVFCTQLTCNCLASTNELLPVQRRSAVRKALGSTPYGFWQEKGNRPKTCPCGGTLEITIADNGFMTFNPTEATHTQVTGLFKDRLCK